MHYRVWSVLIDATHTVCWLTLFTLSGRHLLFLQEKVCLCIASLMDFLT